MQSDPASWAVIKVKSYEHGARRLSFSNLYHNDSSENHCTLDLLFVSTLTASINGGHRAESMYPLSSIGQTIL